MADLPLHPFVVHLTIGLAVAVGLLTPACLLAWVRALLPRRAWWLVVGLQGVLVVSTLASVRSGELASLDARDFLELERIEEHQALGMGLTAAAVASLALSLGAAMVRDERRARQLATASMLVMAGQLALGLATGHAGGRMVWGPEGVIEQAREGRPSLRVGDGER